MTLDFLRKVLPEGLIVIAKPATTGYTQTVVSTFEEAVAQAVLYDSQGKDCYFGLGTLLAPYRTRGRDGKKEVRVGANISELKCLFVDIDVDPNSEKKYPSQLDAIHALKTFCHEESFPAPLLVSSGGGIHAYWPFDKSVVADQWRVVAQAFKGVLAGYGLKADPTRTADASSVLRVVGTHNYKGQNKRPVELIRDAGPYTRKEILTAVSRLADKYHVAPAKISGKPESVLGQNTKHEYPVSNIHKIVSACPQMRDMLQTGGATEPLWVAGLQIARLSENPEQAALLVSSAYPGFQLEEMQRKLAHLANGDIGPATCDQFLDRNPTGCADCEHRGKIKTPIQLGHSRATVAQAPAVGKEEELGGVEATNAPYPFPFAKDEKGRIILKGKSESASITDDMVVHEYQIRPVKRLHSERQDAESTEWRVLQPVSGWREFTIEQSLLAKPEGLHGVLLSKGLYVTPGRIKLMVSFMIAYIKELQVQVATERLFARIGWREEHTKFVLGGAMYERDGTITQHQLSPEIKSELPGLRTSGTLEAWKDAVQFLNAEGHEAHRFMLYAGFGAPLLHMTGHKGAIINGTGSPGAGKTTAVSAAMSIYGHPVESLFNGTKAGSTVNAMYSSLAARNHLPLGMDEITLIDPKIFGEFCLSVSQGMGKIVNTRAGTLAHNRPSWATLVLTTANTDVYSTLGQSRVDAAAEAMRVLQIPFAIPSSRTKVEADKFLRDINTNHGHAGHVFIQYVTENYDLVVQKVLLIMELIERKAGISSSERFWSGAIAVSICGAMIARKLGLLDNFPVETDFEWSCQLPAGARGSLVENLVTPREVISEFLETCVAQTLVVSQTLKAGRAVRIDQAPRGALLVRHEVDADRLYITRSEFKRYCAEKGANYGDIQRDLEISAVLLDRNKPIVLGKGTDFGKGQVRCWEIDMKELREGGGK